MTEAPRRPLTPRRATDQDHHQLAQLTTQGPELAAAVALAQDCAALVRRRQPAALDPWLMRAATSRLPPFRRFARGLRKDYPAVQATVTLAWRQGPIEGQITRLQTLKRHLYGRARLDRLARRFLLAGLDQRLNMTQCRATDKASCWSPGAPAFARRPSPSPCEPFAWAR